MTFRYTEHYTKSDTKLPRLTVTSGQRLLP